MDHEREAHDFLNGDYGDEVAGGEGVPGAARAEPAARGSPNGTHEAECDPLAHYQREARRHRFSESDARRYCCTSHGVDAATAGARNGTPPARAVFRAHRDEVVEGHLDLVVRVARHYLGFGLPLEDLIQEGNMGLLAAIEGFDPDRGVPFPAYAVGWIRQAICRAISVQTRTIRIPLEALGLRRRADSVLSDLEQEAHNDALCSGHYEAPTVEDCARKLGVSAGRLRTTIERLPDMASLDAPVRGDGLPLSSRLADAGQRDPEACAAAEECRSRIGAAVSALPARVRHVMRRHYGLDGNGMASFTEIGRELHLCRERVRQLHNQGLASLRRDVRVRASAS